MPDRLHVVARGRVQGVGFRIATLQKGRSLGLTGWVRNLPDGSVEVECDGGPLAVGQMAAWLRHGPSGAEVTDCEELPPGTGQPYTSFEIRF